MNKFYKGYDDITASSAFKSRMVQTLQSEKKTETKAARERSGGFVIKKRTLAILIAAAVMVLAIGTAVAVGVSTIGRMKENNELRIEMTEDERYQEARAEAIRRMNSVVWDYPVPIDETVMLDDITLTLRQVSVDDANELDLSFAAVSDKTGMIITFDPSFLDGDLQTQRILDTYDTFCAVGTDAVDFRLEIDGTAYAPYIWDDDPVAAGYDKDDAFAMQFHDLPKIENGTKMTLFGTLYRYDKQGGRTGEIGSFRIPFVYDFTDEMREAEIDRLTRMIMEETEKSDAVQQAALSPLPEEATPLEKTVAFTTFHDVAADEDGILLGFTNNWTGKYGGEGSSAFQYFCIDGYLVKEERVAVTWAEDYHCETNLMRLPFYVNRKHMNDVVTVACVELSGRYTKAPDGEGWTAPEEYEEEVFVFRYDLNTGEVTLPKDDAERDAWYTPIASNRTEEAIREVISHSRYDVIDVEGVSDEQNGVPVSIRRIAFGQDGSLSICYCAKNLACEVMIWETYPKEILLNGEKAERTFNKDWNWTEEPFRLSDEQIADIIGTYSMEKTRHITHDLSLKAPARLDMYDGPITVEIKDWDVYDLNKQGERELVGTYSFIFTVDPADAYAFVGVPYEHIPLD